MNQETDTTLYDVWVTWQRNELSTHLKTIIGYQEDNTPIMVDLGSVDLGGSPHVLVHGRSVSNFLGSLVVGLSLRYSPDRFNFMYMDYAGSLKNLDDLNLPHMRKCPTVMPGDREKNNNRTLLYLQEEINRRYELLYAINRDEEINRRDVLTTYRIKQKLDPERFEPLPDLVIILDDLNALIATDRLDLLRLGQILRKGRICGIHLVIGANTFTALRDVQNLLGNVISGTIISFSAHDSRASQFLFHDDRAVNLPEGYFSTHQITPTGEITDSTTGKSLHLSSIPPEWISLLHTLPGLRKTYESKN